MSFSSDVKVRAFVACDRCCCVCHKFKGVKMELHHIKLKSEGGEDSFENAIPLCLDCHAEQSSYDHLHPKGTKYSREELKMHRDKWYDVVRVGGHLPTKIDASVDLRKEVGVVVTTPDCRIADLFFKKLPFNRSIDFIRHNDFSGFSFKLSSLDDLHEFEYICKNPSFCFDDSELEQLKNELLMHVQGFTMLIAINTFPTHSIGWCSVPKEWEGDQPERFNCVVNSIHDSARSIVSCYSNMVLMIRRKLGVIPADIS